MFDLSRLGLDKNLCRIRRGCIRLLFNLGACHAFSSGSLELACHADKRHEADDDPTGIGTLAAAYANRGIIKDRQENYEGALEDYIKAIKIDEEAVGGPGFGTVILNYKFKSSSVKERALYIHEQLQLPENERVLKIKELDEGQVMHKPGKL